MLCVCLLWMAGCPLPPVPSQPPGPSPAPVVKVDAVLVVTVDDWAQRAGNAAVRDFFNDTAYWAKLKQRGHTYNQVDLADAGGYQKQISEAGGTPCVILANAATKKELMAVKLPGTTAALDGLIKKYSDK